MIGDPYSESGMSDLDYRNRGGEIFPESPELEEAEADRFQWVESLGDYIRVDSAEKDSEELCVTAPPSTPELVYNAHILATDAYLDTNPKDGWKLRAAITYSECVLCDSPTRGYCNCVCPF